MRTLTSDNGLASLDHPFRLADSPADTLTPPRSNVAELWGARIGRAILLVAGLVLVWFTFRYLWSAVLPALLALILASVLWPVVRILRRFLAPGLAALMALLGPFTILAGLSLLAAPSVVSDSRQLVGAATTNVGNFALFLETLPFELPGGGASGWVAGASTWLSSNVQTVLGGLMQGIGTLGSLLVVIVLTLIFTFFNLKDGHKFLPWISRWISRPAARHAVTISEQSWRTLSAYISAQAAVALIDAVLIGLALWILGIPLALPLAVIILLAGFVPVIGAVVSGLLATLVAFISHGWITALIILAVVLIVQQVEGNLLQPALVGRSMQIHPAVILASVTVGGTLFGVVGAFLAVPFTAIGIVILRHTKLHLHREATEDAMPTEDLASLHHCTTLPVYPLVARL